MSTTTTAPSGHLSHALREELLRLARCEDDCADSEAVLAHYWEPMPLSVAIHRQCAAALRAAADELLRADDGRAGRG
jgi:hypothetical protein